MSKWNKRFLELAKHVSGWSKDPSTQVGAVIASGKHVVSLGYNGFPPGIEDNGRLQHLEAKHEIVIHAEENALLNARQDVSGCAIYVYPLNPCTRCAAKLIAAGIAEVYFLHPEIRLEEKYQLDKVLQYFREANIAYCSVNTNFDIVELWGM